MNAAGETNAKVYFLSFVDRNYSRSSVLLNFNSQNLYKEFISFKYETRQIVKQLYSLKKVLDESSIIVIMSPSHKITVLARMILGCPIILDAGWPLTDGVMSRGLKPRTIGKLITSFLLDFISFHSSSHILVESNPQLSRIRKYYFVSLKKMTVSFTGLNETAFEPQMHQGRIAQTLSLQLRERSFQLVVLFRGKINKESGIDVIVGAAKTLINEMAFVILTGVETALKELPSNCFIISNVTASEMAQIYEISDIALGQLSNHPRLSYTIPHKAFEAGYFAKCYVTADSRGVQELYSEQNSVYVPNVNVENLVLVLKNLQSRELREKYGESINKRYRSISSQEILNQSFERLIAELHSK